jgi:hypothetical protein
MSIPVAIVSIPVSIDAIVSNKKVQLKEKVTREERQRIKMDRDLEANRARLDRMADRDEKIYERLLEAGRKVDELRLAKKLRQTPEF